MNEQQIIVIRQVQDVHVLQLQGPNLSERDTVASVERQLDEYLEQHKPTKLVLDFTPVNFLTSEMLSMLLRLRDLAEARGTRVRLSGLSHTVRDVFHVTRLDRVFGIDDELDGAVAALVT